MLSTLGLVHFAMLAWKSVQSTALSLFLTLQKKLINLLSVKAQAPQLNLFQMIHYYQGILNLTLNLQKMNYRQRWHDDV